VERNTQTKYDEAINFFNKFGEFTEKCLNVLFNEVKSPASKTAIAVFLQEVIEKEAAWKRRLMELKAIEEVKHDGSA